MNKKIKFVGFSKEASELIKENATNTGSKTKTYLDELSNAVIKAPKEQFVIDTCDHFATFAGIPLSWLRNWNDGKALVMLTSEALKMNEAMRC